VSSPRRSTARFLALLVAASLLVRLVLLTRVQGPWIFPDELGYQQVAVNIARGRLALYSENGLSYSPLYPLVLSPLFALGLSGPDAYGWIKAINALLMSLSLLPAYGIARHLLPRRPAYLVAVLVAVAPLMYYTALGMSENLAFPLVLVAVWLLLRTLDRPSPRNDLWFLVAVVAAAATRIQLVTLLPTGVTALALVGLIPAHHARPRLTDLRRQLDAHRTLVLGSIGLVAAGVVPAVFGHSPFSAAGRYSNVPGTSHPSLVHMAKLFVYHAAELFFATGGLPFAATVAATWILVTRGASRRSIILGSTTVAVAFWLLVETAIATDSFERQGDAPRIHERYLFYLVPLFLTVFVAALRHERVRRTRVGAALGIAAGVLAALAIPYQTVINGTVVADTFSLQFVAQERSLQAVAHASLVALVVAVVLAAAFALLRSHPAAAVGVLVAAFVVDSALLGARIERAAGGANPFFTSSHYDWVDRTHPRTGVALVTGPSVTDPVAEWHTAYYNLKIDRLYYTCRRTLSRDFGERRVSVTRSGTLLADGAPLRVHYAVVPGGLGVIGRTLARDRVANEVLVAPSGGVLRIDPAHRARWRCQTPA
jgi:hypothetical protein